MKNLLEESKQIVDESDYDTVIIIGVKADGAYDSADWSRNPEQIAWAHQKRIIAEQAMQGFPDNTQLIADRKRLEFMAMNSGYAIHGTDSGTFMIVLYPKEEWRAECHDWRECIDLAMKSKGKKSE